MTLLRLRYVHRFRDRHGRIRHYARIPGRKQVPLRGEPGSAEFMEDYQAALADAPRREIGAGRTKPGSVAEIITAYYRDVTFASLAPSTQKMRRAILERFRSNYGDRPIAPLRSAHLATLIGPMTPSAARNWRKTLRGLMQFAVATGRLKEDPTAGVKLPKGQPGEIHSWTEDEISQFEKHHPIGSKPRLAMALHLYTGQRRSDVVTIGRQHIRNGVIAVRQQKTGKALEIPIHPALATILYSTPSDHLTFLTTGSGKPFSPAGFGNVFRDWCNEADLPSHCSAHGLRKAACRRLAEAGCSEHEIASISGHESLAEVQRYTKAARQAKLARAAIATVTEAFPAAEGQAIGKPK